MFTMRAASDLRRNGSAARITRVCAVSSTFSEMSHCALKSGPSIALKRAIPALFTTMSSRPKAVAISGTTRATSASEPTSITQPRAAPPVFAISSTTFWTASLSRSVTATFAPSSAKRCAVARPMPLAAPVTRAARPAIERESLVSRGMARCYRKSERVERAAQARDPLADPLRIERRVAEQELHARGRPQVERRRGVHAHAAAPALLAQSPAAARVELGDLEQHVQAGARAAHAGALAELVRERVEQHRAQRRGARSRTARVALEVTLGDEVGERELLQRRRAGV